MSDGPSKSRLTIRCIHYGGIDLETLLAGCAIGCDPNELAGPGDGKWLRLPCIQSDETSACSRREWKSLEQTEAEQAKQDIEAAASVARHTKAFAALPKIGWGEECEIECPNCGKRLRHWRAESNGHSWGQCETEECVSWMQ